MNMFPACTNLLIGASFCLLAACASESPAPMAASSAPAGTTVAAAAPCEQPDVTTGTSIKRRDCKSSSGAISMDASALGASMKSMPQMDAKGR
ncbi:hypothetical protein AAKU55_003396 [Oxalobacteraceae bacterium GrIS 1.11]